MTIVVPFAADAAATLTVPFVRALMDDWARRLRSTLGYFGDDIPDFHDVTAGRWAVNGFWTEGFWPGLLWHLHAHSGDATLAGEARRTTRIVARMKVGMDDHDLGFLFEPSCLLEHTVTGADEMLPAAEAAARRLANLYLPSGRYLPAHGPPDGPGAGFAIIDTIMNLPLLLWAGRRSGESRYGEIAREFMQPIAKMPPEFLDGGGAFSNFL